MNPKPDTSVHPSAEPSILTELIAATVAGGASAARPSGVVVGTCLDEQHPDLPGRVLIRISENGADRDLWVCALVHSIVRRDDRVLLLQPANWPEPVVVGVLDGLRPRHVLPVSIGNVALRRDEQIAITDDMGAPLLTIVPTAAGPLLRLASADQRLEIAGRLSLAADVIELRARGGLTLASGADVVVTGEEIKLN
jgi:hypothetical protein